MGEQPLVRRSYEESCRRLQEIGYLEDGEFPPLPGRRPEHDDDPLGLSFFRTQVADDDLECLTLPRTFFGRSAVESVSFRGTDLSESCLCWNDFTDVDFTDADLRLSDLRGSCFVDVRFVRTDLSGADLRRSSFDACDFTDAVMSGAKLTREQGEAVALSRRQRGEIDWQDAGEEPPGG